MKRLNLVILFFIFCAAIPNDNEPKKIKSAAYWTSPIMSVEQAIALSVNKYDFVIADYENMFNNHGALDTLKKLSPNTKILAYVNPTEIFAKQLPNRPLQNSLIERINQRYPAWLLRDKSGQSIVFYEGMKMMNISSVCPKINKRNYSEWLSDTLIHKVYSDPIWDGTFLDNNGKTVSWVNSSIDANSDWLPDSMAALDGWWEEGLRSFLKKIRSVKGKGFVIIGNKGSVDFTDLVDGRMFEFFPNDYLGGKKDGGWWQSMSNASQTGPFTIFMVKEKDLNFALASALLLDNVYIAVGQNNSRFYPQLQEKVAKGGDIKLQRQLGDGKTIEVVPSQKSGVLINK